MPVRNAIGADERRMIDEVLTHYGDGAPDYGYQGPFEERYCQAFADYQGGGYADSVATGTAAIFVAVAAMSLPENSEVLVSPITDPGTLSAIVLNGLKPRLVDSGEGSYNVTLETVQAAMSENVSGAVLVHSAGQGIADIAGIADFLRDRGVALVEDCSQTHGAEVSGRKVGTFGDIAAFSTMYRKAHITGASGGVVICRDIDLYHMVLAHADRGKPSWEPSFDFRNPRYFLFPALNFHTDELSCAIGLASLARLDDVMRARRRYVSAVCDGLADIPGVSSYGYGDSDSPFFQPVMVDEGQLTCDKRTFADAVAAEGIDINPHYEYLVVNWPWLRPYLAAPADTPNARQVLNTSFNLYLNENYGNPEVADTLAAIAKVAAAFTRN